MIIQKQKDIIIDLIKNTQIKAQIRALIFDKAYNTILAQYFNYNSVFLVENISKFSIVYQW